MRATPPLPQEPQQRQLAVFHQLGKAIACNTPRDQQCVVSPQEIAFGSPARRGFERTKEEEGEIHGSTTTRHTLPVDDLHWRCMLGVMEKDQHEQGRKEQGQAFIGHLPGGGPTLLLTYVEDLSSEAISP